MNRSFVNHPACLPGIPAVRCLERDGEVTRDELDRTLDELQAKLSPRRQLRDALRGARQTGAELSRIAADYSRRHRLPMAIAAALLLTLGGRRIIGRRSP